MPRPGRGARPHRCSPSGSATLPRRSPTIGGGSTGASAAVNNAAKRDGDTQTVVEALKNEGFTTVLREPTHEEDAVHVACLAETSRQDDLETAVGELAEDWRGRARLRLLGPLAPYDFVVTKRA